MAMALGWFSLALGIAELMAPRQVAELIGAPQNEGTEKTLRAYGAREIASGIAILSYPTESRWLWSRVGGDALDLATLGAAGRHGAPIVRDSRSQPPLSRSRSSDVIAAIGCVRSFNEFGVNVANEQAITIRAPLEAVEAGGSSGARGTRQARERLRDPVRTGAGRARYGSASRGRRLGRKAPGRASPLQAAA